MILNRQRSISIPSIALGRFLGRIRRELKLGRSDLTVCFVTDRTIEDLNRKFRGFTPLNPIRIYSRRTGRRFRRRRF